MKTSVIEPEHILLGLLKDQNEITANVFQELGIEYAALKKQIIENIRVNETLFDPDDLDLSRDTRKLLELAVTEARRMEHNYIGCEHLLLGLSLLPRTRIIRLLKQAGIPTDQIRPVTRQTINRWREAQGLAPHPIPTTTWHSPFTNYVRQRGFMYYETLESGAWHYALQHELACTPLSDALIDHLLAAVDETRQMKLHQVGAEQMLLALARNAASMRDAASMRNAASMRDAAGIWDNLGYSEAEISTLHDRLRAQQAVTSNPTDRILHEPPPPVTPTAIRTPPVRNRWFSFAGISSRFRHFSLQRELDQTPLSAEALKGLLTAIETARQTGTPQVEVQHLLLSLLETQSQIWDNLGYNKEEIEALRDKVRQQVMGRNARETASL